MPGPGFQPFEGDGKCAPHPSWNHLDAWRAFPDEDVRRMHRREVPLAIDLKTDPRVLRERLTMGIRRALEREPDLRSHHVEWTFSGDAQEPRSGMLYSGMRMIWDGMRSLPYSNEQLAAALGTWPAIWMLGVHSINDRERAEAGVASLLGECIYIEMGRGSAAGNRSYVAEATLRRALRPDLDSVLAEDEFDSRNDLRRLMQGIFSPSRLFDHGALVDAFAREIVPAQMLRWVPNTQTSAFFFCPAAVDTFGLP